MNSIRIAILAFSTFTLFACSSHASRVAAFCKGVDKDQVQLAGLQVDPTKPLIQKAAQAMGHLADIAPSDIKPAIEEEASAYRKWAKTGNNAPLTQKTFSVADSQVAAWLHLNCKGH